MDPSDPHRHPGSRRCRQPSKSPAHASFPAWLAEQKLSLALTTYQIGKLFFIGLKDNGELSIFERSFNRCMGLCMANGLYLSSLYQVWRFENLFTAGEQQDGLRPALSAAGRLHHRRPRHPRPGGRRRRPAGLRQHAVRLPGDALRDAQLQAAVAPAVPQPAWRPRTAAT
jgi:hypothetical protein